MRGSADTRSTPATGLVETDVEAGGRVLHAYDTGPTGRPDELAVLWHHGTPNTGPPPKPLLPAAARLGVRWVGYDRPGYGRSTPRPGRDVASAAGDAAAVADALGIARFAVMGHSGGGPHALACAALLPGRVSAAAAVASVAPYDGAGLDFFAGMCASGVDALRAALAGRETKAAWEREHGDEYDPEFTEADLAALRGPWTWLNDVVRAACAEGPPPGAVDDDLAFASPWGFDTAGIDVPVLLVQGQRDRVVPPGHADWLAEHVPRAELWRRPDDGHISTLGAAEAALVWLVERARLPR